MAHSYLLAAGVFVVGAVLAVFLREKGQTVARHGTTIAENAAEEGE